MPLPDHIFVRDGGTSLKVFKAGGGYAKELDLQTLIADHPELLHGEQIDPSTPRKWMLLGREVGIPDVQGVTDRWAIDLLFLDQDATPTFVEVKLSSNNQIRREVVGQLIEYAANAKRHWPKGRLHDLAVKSSGGELDSRLRRLFDGEEPAPDFWERAEVNLRSGNVRLVFAADRIPSELYEMALFLNEQMTDTEVLAIEIQPYLAEGAVEIFVPRVLNATPKALEVKSINGNRKKWDEVSFFSDVKKRHPTETAEAALRKLLEFSRAHATTITWGSGVQRGSFNPKYNQLGVRSPISVFSDGELNLNGFWMDEPYASLLKKASLDLFGSASNDRGPERIPLEVWSLKQEALFQRLEEIVCGVGQKPS